MPQPWSWMKCQRGHTMVVGVVLVLGAGAEVVGAPVVAGALAEVVAVAATVAMASAVAVAVVAVAATAEVVLAVAALAVVLAALVASVWRTRYALAAVICQAGTSPWVSCASTCATATA